MLMTPRYLDWNKPLLETVANELLAPFDEKDGASSRYDLSDIVVIVQTAQAGRRLRERLAAIAYMRKKGVLAPRVLQPAQFLQLGVQQQNVACRAEELAVTAAVLQDLFDKGALAHLFPHHDEPARETNRHFFLEAAQRILELRRALAECGLDCSSAAQRLTRALPPDALREPERWDDLIVVEKEYRAVLRRGGRTDATDAARAALTEPCLPEDIRRVVFAAVPDPMPLAMSFAEALPAHIQCEIWIYAPSTLAECFDNWGRPRANAWDNRILPLDANEIELLVKPVEQALATKACIEELKVSPAATATAVALGVVDPEIVPPIVRELATLGIRVADPTGRSLTSHSIFLLVRFLLDLVCNDRYADFSQLLRHPDFCNYLVRSVASSDNIDAAQWRLLLTQSDEFHNLRLPYRFSDAVQRLQSADDADRFALLKTAAELTQRYVQQLQRSADAPEQALLAILSDVYTTRILSSANADDAAFAAATGELHRVIEDSRRAAALAHLTDPHARFDLMVATAQPVRYAARESESMLDAEGWLELIWNDAPHLLLAGFNDGRVPAGITADPFLPGAARTALGLTDNDMRCARDAYLLEALLTRRRACAANVRILVGKTSQAGDVLRPSRLLFLCSEQDLPQRARQLFTTKAHAGQRLEWTAAFHLTPPSAPPFTRMSVSAFGDYLRCPFRFYLKHALHMASLDDRAFELDPADFGSLCHAVLKAFYDNEQLRDSTDSRRIAAFLKETVERLAAERFCQSRSAAVAFQLATLTQRLEAFADKQAEHRAAGWRIIHAELSFGGDKQHGFHIGNMPIRGRIDRIDRDERTGAHLLLDYKTSDSSEQPADTHLANPSQFPELPAWATVHANGRRWVDLQLPLYCLYAQYARMENVQVGYVNLPKAATQTRFAIWEDLDADLLDAARRCAEGVVERVRNGVFWPPRKGVDCWEDDSIRALLVRGAEHAVKPWEQWTQAVLDETGAQVHS